MRMLIDDGALRHLGQGPLLLHTDLFRLRVLDPKQDRETNCRAFEKMLIHHFPNRPLLFPTFNYDYCRDGIYDRVQSPSHVGVFTDYLRLAYPDCRSLTPVFHFCILQNSDLSLEASENCFGEQSLFAELVRRNGTIGFLGASFSSNTFLHHVEEMCDISYRMHKRFSGVIIDGAQRRPFTLIYRVRPLDPPNSVVYDWPRIQTDLREKQLLHDYPAGKGQFLFCRARELFYYWFEKITHDERYLLSR